MTTKITCIGDSHAKYFLPKLLGYARMGVNPKRLRFEGQAITAASLAGFRPGRSTLDTKAIIDNKLKDADRVILAFGQVDLELGYYYRSVIKGEHLTPNAYIAWLHEIYRNFLVELETRGKRVAVKGVNLTVLCQKPFATRYVSRIIDRDRGDDAAQLAALREIILSENEQNSMHLSFNAGLAALVEELDMLYFDINTEISRRDPISRVPMPERGVSPEFIPGHFDHHLADTLPVRTIHVAAATRVFGLNDHLPKDWSL